MDGLDDATAVGAAEFPNVFPLIELLAELIICPPLAACKPVLLPLIVDPETCRRARVFRAWSPIPLLTTVEFETVMSEKPLDRIPIALLLAIMLL